MRCPHCKKEILVKPRSNNQNRYFYGVALNMLAEHTGYSVKQIKGILKEEFGWVEYANLNGKSYKTLRSSADMSSAEFEKFMTQIRQFGDTLGVYIPQPREFESLLTE